MNVKTKRDGPEARIFIRTTITEHIPGLNKKYYKLLTIIQNVARSRDNTCPALIFLLIEVLMGKLGDGTGKAKTPLPTSAP